MPDKEAPLKRYEWIRHPDGVVEVIDDPEGEWVRASDYRALYEAADKLASAVDKWRHSFATPDNIGPDDDELVAALAAFKGENNA